ncbi:MAG: hypothetical protein K2Y18_03150 [Alphaproteobacteria bacterium]|nr:hypothetical protein [Alphaproteobacteria bacterium]
MKSIWTQIIATILGGFLAAGAGWFVDWNRESRRNENIQNLALTALRDDLQNSIILYDKLIEDFDKTNTIWLATIFTLQESRQFYQKNKEWMVIFDDKDLRDKVFQYYVKSELLFRKLEFMQKKKQDIENILSDNLNRVKIEHPTWKEEDIKKAALIPIEDKRKEYINLTSKLIPELISEVKESRHIANSLISSLHNRIIRK